MKKYFVITALLCVIAASQLKADYPPPRIFGKVIAFETQRNKSALEAFEDAINDEHCCGVIVVDFCATWCGPCNALAPYIKALAEEMPMVKFIKVDIDEYEAIAKKYKIKTIPQLFVFKDGKKVKVIQDTKTKKAIKKAIEAEC